MQLNPVTLDDKYDLTCDRIFVTGTQAIVRMLLMQRERDRRAGLDTAGFVSGYRGSPIGGLDQQLWAAATQLAAIRHHFPTRPQRGTGGDSLLGHSTGRDRRAGPS
jgi:hypothetical protein